jgi:hypothetical protein
MKKMIAILAVAMIMINGCTDNKLSYYKDTTPKADIKNFFNGKIKAWGIVQDWRGRVVTRFDVDMVGSWKGNVGILEEDFRYYNGKTGKRTWHITKNEDGTYQGTADDIIGKAAGKSEGSAFNWVYTMDIPVDQTTYRLKVDDWMWQMNDGVLMNRSYFKKFGITVAELTLFMQKQD